MPDPDRELQDAVLEIVHQWFEQALVETVIGIKQLKGSKEWGLEEIEKALSPEALTSAVMQRYHVYIACKREVGAKFESLSHQVNFQIGLLNIN
jgi:hypothetical protein